MRPYTDGEIKKAFTEGKASEVGLPGRTFRVDVTVLSALLALRTA